VKSSIPKNWGNCCTRIEFGAAMCYDGFVARYVGDGILTYFGWPTAHEEGTRRA
jgi:hypothetical protein